MACSIRLNVGALKVSRVTAWLMLLLVIACAAPAGAADQQSTSAQTAPSDPLNDWISPDRVTGTCSTVLLISALSLAPALLLMTTSFVRISIVLALVRQALGTPAVPSNQISAGLALFMTAAIMTPAARVIHQQAILPYQAREISWQEAIDRAKAPLHRFMARQIERTGNADDVWLFLDYSGADSSRVTSYDDVPFQVLAPAYLLSELKTAFLIGFQIYLPFLVIDLVVSAVIAGMGLVMVPPTIVALPSKLLLFIMVDGWHLIVRTLLESFS
jgi:flagellar biosynthesis protein FliP